MNKKLLSVISFLSFKKINFQSQNLSKLQNYKLVNWLCLLMFFGMCNQMFAADRYAVANGNWNATTTWSATSGGVAGASVPVAADNVYIQGVGRTVTVTADGATCAILDIASGATLSVGDYNFIVRGVTSISGTLTHVAGAITKSYYGLVTVNAGGNWNNLGSRIVYRGGITNNGTFTSGTSPQVFNTNAQVLTGTLIMAAVNTSVAITNNATWTVSTSIIGTTGTIINNATLNYGGTPMEPTLTATAVNNTVNYTNSSPVIKGITYYNLQFSGTGTTATPSAALTITGNLTNTGGGTLNFGNVAVTISGTATQNIAGFTTTGALTVSKTGSSIATFTGNVNTGIFNHSSTASTLNLGIGLTHTFSGNATLSSTSVTNGGTSFIRFGGYLQTNNSNSFVPGTSTVEFYAAGNQNLPTTSPTTFYNLILSGGGSKFFGHVITVNNNLSIVAGTRADLYDKVHSAVSLTLGGEGTVGGSGVSWGNTSSPATNKTNTYFDPLAARVGIINVSSNTATTVCNVPLRVTPVAICQGAASQALNAGTTIATSGSNYTITGSWNIATNPVANRPGGETGGPFDDTTQCLFIAGELRSYVTTSFQVTLSGNYTFRMTDDNNIDGMGYIYTGNFTPGDCNAGGTFVRGDDDRVGPTILNEPEMVNVPLIAGVIYTLVTTNYGTSINAPFTWTVIPPTSGGLTAPSWYNVATGGTALATGSSYNPVPSDISNTNTPQIKTYYVGFPSTGCRTPVNYTIAANAVTLSSTAGTNAQSKCINTAITNITYTAIGATNGSVTGLPAGVTGAWANNVFTISGTPTAAGLFTYTVTLTSPCTNVTATGSITVSSAATANTATAINCGGFTANWTSVAGATTYLLDVSDNNAFSTFVTGYLAKDVGLVSSAVVTTLEAGKTYYFRVTAVSPGCGNTLVSNVISVLVNAAVTNTWAGTWSQGTPTAAQNIVFASGTFTSAGTNIVGCTCQVNSGATVIISKGDTMTITNGVNVADNTLTFLDDSSLIQINNATNSGKIRYERQTTLIRRYDFTFWSTPVFEPTLVSVSPLTYIDKYHSYSGTGWVYEDPNNVMKVGKGYSIRAPQTFSIENTDYYTAPFVGVPNNGNINGESVVAGNYYLAGNPYPSAISLVAFMAANDAILEGTVEFWSHGRPPVFNPVTQKYEYNGDDYLAWNSNGSVSGPNGTYPDLIIAAGQAVSVKAENTITAPNPKIIFNNDMRVGLAGKNSQFFKPGKTDESAPAKSRVWINLTNSGGVFKQLLLGYVEGATNEYEDDFDAISSDANPYADFYSIANGNNYVIQGKAVPFDQDDIVPLGVRIAYAGDFTITLARFDGLFDAGNVYLEDKVLNKTHNLKQGDYTFNIGSGVFNERFVLNFKDNTLKTDDFDKTENGLTVSVKEKIIKVKSDIRNIKEVSVYDVSGKLLYHKNYIDNTSLTIERLQSGNQVLLVKVLLDNNHVATKKIIF